MDWREVLKAMGFKQIEEGSNIYTNGNLGNSEFNFGSRQSIDAIAACIWDTAQYYGEKKREQEILKNILK